MDYTTFYQNNQPYDMVFPVNPHTTSQQSSEGYNSISPPPYATFDAPFQHFDNDTTNIRNASLVSNGDAMGLDLEPDSQNMLRSSSEEKEQGTQQHPIMQRRKAQNRAAERKERHVKDLEERLTSLESNSSKVQAENERLKLELQKMSTENQILRATSKETVKTQDHTEDVRVGPPSYSPNEFFNTLLAPHKDKTPNHRVVRTTNGQRLVGAGAAWDMIISDPLVEDGIVDIALVCEQLKPMALCDGQGPVFEESAVRNAIATSASAGKDELI